MTSDERLAEIVSALEEVGITSLVMGGHAVRHYGLNRNTNDIDMHLSPDCWNDLPQRLSESSLFKDTELHEGSSWRSGSFRRFRVGTMSSGAAEWLEFWRDNHLLPPFEELYARRELGTYGGRGIAFLGLPDLMRSKETERESDWQDISFLEEVSDSRLASRFDSGDAVLPEVLSKLRSRRGFESYLQRHSFEDAESVKEALMQTQHSVTQAYLLPLTPDLEPLIAVFAPIEAVVEQRLRTLSPGTPLHLALVESVRRRYKLARQAEDKADKESIRETS